MWVVVPVVRKLLNIEKSTFQANTDEYQIKVTAHRTGVPINTQRLDDPVVYNIVVNKLFFGAPWCVWKVILAMLVASFVVIRYLVPSLMRTLVSMT